MKINTRQKLLNLNGKAIKDSEDKDFTLGVAIGNMLGASKTEGAYKIYILGKKFYKEENITLDEADMALVKSELKKSDFSALIKGQVEGILIDIENKEEARVKSEKESNKKKKNEK